VPETGSLERALECAIDFLVDSREANALLWLELVHRRFGTEAFAGSLRTFDRIVSEGAEGAARLRVFRRIADPDSSLPLEDLSAISHPSDAMIVQALYCDRVNLPASFPDTLRQAMEAGGYFCTHALLAWIWVQEFGGQLEAPEGFAEQLFAANAGIVNDDRSEVTDLKLEAAAFLYLAGQGQRVAPAFADIVLKTQNPDGGWGATRAHPGVSDWHGTVLALLFLLHQTRESTA